MSNGHTNGHSRALQLHAAQMTVQPTGEHGQKSFEYSHIVVPLNLFGCERSAVMLGLQLAAVNQAKVTLLRVLSPPSDTESSHGLNAFDHLFSSPVMNLPIGTVRTSNDVGAIELARTKVLKFLAREIPAAIQRGVEIHVECRVGDFAYETVHFADHSGVDLVVLSSELSIGGLPILPSQVRRVLRLTRKPVVVVRHAPRRREVDVEVICNAVHS